MKTRTGLLLVVATLILAGALSRQPKEPAPKPTPSEEVVATMLAPCFAAVPEEDREVVRGLHLLSDGHALLVQAARLYPDRTRRLVSDPTFRELCDQHGVGELLRHVESPERLTDLLRDERLLAAESKPFPSPAQSVTLGQLDMLGTPRACDSEVVAIRRLGAWFFQIPRAPGAVAVDRLGRTYIQDLEHSIRTAYGSVESGTEYPLRFLVGC